MNNFIINYLMRGIVPGFDTQVYATNENFRRHYQQPERGHKESRKQYRDGPQASLNQKDLRFTQYNQGQVNSNNIPKTNYYKFFQDKIILNDIATNFKQTKVKKQLQLDDIQLRQKLQVSHKMNLLDLKPTIYEPCRKSEYTVQKDKCVDNLSVPQFDHSAFNQNSIEFSKFNYHELKQKEYIKDHYEKKMRIFNKYTLNKINKIDKEKGCLLLIIKNEEFQIVNSFNSVKFCYYFLSKKDQLSEAQIDRHNQQVVDLAKQRLKITSKHVYLFEKDGSPVNNIFELTNHTLFLSSTPMFHGINNITSKKNASQIQDIVKILEKPLHNQFGLTSIRPIEQKIKEKYSEPINYIYEMVSGGKPKGINFDKYQKFENPDEYFNSTKNILKRDTKLQDEIKELYKSDVYQMKKRNNLEEDENAENDNEVNLSPEQKETLKQIASLLDQKIPDPIKAAAGEEFEMEIFRKDKDQRSYINENIRDARSDKALIKELQRFQVGFYRQNIPKTILETGLNRRTLHQFYTLYQVLTHLTLNQKVKDYDKSKGVNFESYKNGLRENFVYNEDFLQNVFNLIDQNHSGYLGWKEFLSLLLITRNKNLDDKINLFIKIADQQKSGHFTNKQIFDQAKLSLKKIVHEDPQALEEICRFFTSLIFKAIGKQEHETIQFAELKNAITNNNQDSNLLAMFCGADI